LHPLESAAFSRRTPQANICSAANCGLLDHLVGGHEQARWHGEAQRLRGFALAADEIVLGEFSVLGPIDPQIAGFPAASIVRARDSKPPGGAFDLTLVLADMGEKALSSG
jgi:Serine dehydrogenase proteinase